LGDGRVKVLVDDVFNRFVAFRRLCDQNVEVLSHPPAGFVELALQPFWSDERYDLLKDVQLPLFALSEYMDLGRILPERPADA
jgi:hypothetical protein